jgi:hypothetical protein
MERNKRKPLLRLCPLYQKRNARGAYLAGRQGDLVFIIFENHDPRDDKSPAAWLFLGEREEWQEDQ